MVLREDRFRNLLLISILLGVGVGLFSAGFALLWRWLDGMVWGLVPSPVHRLWISPLVGLLIGLIMQVLFDPGNMSTIVKHFHDSGRLPYADNKPILPVSLLGLVGGQSAGPEGVLTQVCGSMGTWLSQWFDKPRFVRVLTLAGMGAGFGAFLRSPVGGAVLWLEMLHRRGIEYYEAMVPTILCSFVAYMVMTGVLGLDLVPMWHYPAFTPEAWSQLLAAVGVGICCAGVAFVYAWMFRFIGRTFGHWPIPIYVRTTLAGLVIGVLGVTFPLSYFYGGYQMNRVLNEALPLWVVLGTLVAKMLAASFTIRGHWQGGLVIPHLLMGALVGKALHLLMPELPATLAMLAGMAGFNAAATQTPLASALIVLALTGFGNPIPIFLASLTGYLAGYRIDLIEHKGPRTEQPGFHLPDADDGVA